MRSKTNISLWSVLGYVSVGLLLLSPTTSHAQWATLQGQFVYGGKGAKLPTRLPLTVTKDKATCCKVPLFDESLVIHPKSRGIQDVIIWAYKPKSVHPKMVKPPAKPALVQNKNCRFDPHVVLVRAGQKLEVGNPDPVGHNAMVSFLKNPGQNPMLPPNATATFSPEKAEIIPVKLSCSIHPWMQGIILVQDHPYMVKTDENGKFELKDLPTGELVLKVWHEKLGYIKSFTVDNDKLVTLKRGKYTLNLANGAKEKHVYEIDPALFADKR